MDKTGCEFDGTITISSNSIGDGSCDICNERLVKRYANLEDWDSENMIIICKDCLKKALEMLE